VLLTVDNVFLTVPVYVIDVLLDITSPQQIYVKVSWYFTEIIICLFVGLWKSMIN